MIKITMLQLSLRRAGFVGIGMLFILAALIPFDLQAGSLPGPDILYCLTMVFVIRRPEYVPVVVGFSGVFPARYPEHGTFGAD